MSYIALRAELAESGQMMKWLNKLIKDCEEYIYGIDFKLIPDEFSGLCVKEEE